MAMIAQTPRTRHQQAQFKAAAARSAALSLSTVGDLVSRKIEKASQFQPAPILKPGCTRQAPPTRRPAPTPARPFGVGVLTYASELPKPIRHDDRSVQMDCGAVSPSERNPKAADLVSDRDKADWISMCAEREAREQARESVAQWKEAESRREIIEGMDLRLSRYEVSVNVSGCVVSDW